MKLRLAIATAILIIPVPFVSMTEPAAAANTHVVVLTGHMKVIDSPGLFTGKRVGEFNFEKRATLTHDRTRATLSTGACVRDSFGLLTVQLELTRFEYVAVTPTIRLYEGSTCLSDDLDGEKSAITQGVTVGESKSWNLEVVNSEFNSLDYAGAKFFVRNTVGADVGRPREPSNVVATRDPGNNRTVVVQWVDNATNESGYEIRNTTLNNTTLPMDADRTTFTWPNLDPSVRHCFQIRAVNAQGPSAWTPVSPRGECA
ncbi:fibronectin type III domain-containing protein [Streptomyces sp. NPDC052721]|uniref:fibronectin type III domain-containing protein n=1 Tax=Streptomyces sp. NPDC052721 TaxID=3154955 RepID=UPI00341D2967